MKFSLQFSKMIWREKWTKVWADGQLYSLDPSSLITELTHEDIKQALVLNPDQAVYLEKKMFFSGMARSQLVLLFLMIIAIVWYSSLKRKESAQL